MTDLIAVLTGLGPTGLLAGAVIVLWMEYQKARTMADTEKANRLADAQAFTTKALELYDRLHPPDDDRRSRHD